MSELEKFLEKSKQLREAATPGRLYVLNPALWRLVVGTNEPNTVKLVADCLQEADALDIAYARNTSETKDEMIRVMAEALEWIMPKVHQGNHEGELAECGKATCIEYRKALARVEELAKERG